MERRSDISFFFSFITFQREWALIIDAMLLSFLSLSQYFSMSFSTLSTHSWIILSFVFKCTWCLQLSCWPTFYQQTLLKHLWNLWHFFKQWVIPSLSSPPRDLIETKPKLNLTLVMQQNKAKHQRRILLILI